MDDRPSSFSRILTSALAAGSLAVPLQACSPDGPSPLGAETPIHLEEHLQSAAIEGSAPPADLPEAAEWRFDEPRPEWRPVVPADPSVAPVRTTGADDALRIHLDEDNAVTGPGGGRLAGGLYLELPDWRREDWAQVLVEARTEDRIGAVSLRFNLREAGGASGEDTSGDAVERAFLFGGEYADLFTDGTVHTYALDADWSYGSWQGPWQHLGLVFAAQEPGSIDLLSVTVVPKEAGFAGAPVGVETVARGGVHRRALYMHAPGRISYPVEVPEAGRLDTGLGVLRGDSPVTFRVSVRPGGDQDAGGDAGATTLLERSHGDEESWSLQGVDLSEWAGRVVTLSLEAEAERDGTVALWASPTLSGSSTLPDSGTSSGSTSSRDSVPRSGPVPRSDPATPSDSALSGGRRATDLPNVILYVIDGGGADYMSVYGYNRRTTPHLERLAAEAAVFEHAYSNSTWSKTSTPSFMTGLQHSVLGGYVNESDRIPADVVTLPEHLHRAGYQTAVITSNPYAGTMSGLDQGVDFLREHGTGSNSTSSRELHEEFWEWRDTFPGEPWFVHFQTTDVHWPWQPTPPFAGSFADAEDRRRYREWERRLAEAAGMPAPRWLSAQLYPDEAFEETGIDRQAFFHLASALYDETLAHNDRQIGRLVERLKVTGAWENTLLIVGADHGNNHGYGTFEPAPRWGPLFRPFVTRVPLIVVWPGRIPAGQRFTEPVSMIDVLPTILGLAGLPHPETTQGQSLAPLLRGQPGVEVEPVILEEAYFEPHTRALSWAGIEIIDGRWGASLSIEPESDGSIEPESVEDPDDDEGANTSGPTSDRRPSDLLLYDLWADPFCLRSLHAERPELADHYRELLLRRWEDHQELARRFDRAPAATLTPGQLRTLRALGYIR